MIVKEEVRQENGFDNWMNDPESSSLSVEKSVCMESKIYY